MAKATAIGLAFVAFMLGSALTALYFDEPAPLCDPATQVGRGWDTARQCERALKSAEDVLDHADVMMKQCIEELKSCGGGK
mgnify:CR=1 FL=1